MTNPNPPTAEEKTAGIIVYRKSKPGIRFLLLYHGGDYWNFPKGHLETEETSFSAALRETAEETGLAKNELKIHSSFLVHNRFPIRRGGSERFKNIVYFLAETRQPIIKVSWEHYGYGWFLYKDALKILKHKNLKENLRRAYQALQSRRGPVPPKPNPR